MLSQTVHCRIPALLLALLASAAALAAAKAPPAAVARHGQALLLVRQGEHRAAIHEFLAAYRLHPAPSILFNVALTYDTLSANGSVEDLAEARRFYLRYLEEMAQPRDRAEVEERLRHLDDQLQRRRCLCPDLGAPLPSPPAEAPTTTVSRPPVHGARAGERGPAGAAWLVPSPTADFPRGGRNRATGRGRE